MLKKLIPLFLFLFFADALAPIVVGQPKMPTAPCEIYVAELPVLVGASFDMKMEDLKKKYKAVRVITTPKDEIMGQTKIHTLRPLATDQEFKFDLVSIEMAHSSNFGITSISLNFRPRTKLTPAELFSKINLETGLLPSFWIYNDYGGQANYQKWGVDCIDFSASFIAQTGYMNRLSIWRNPYSNPKKKPIDTRNIGD